MKKDWLCNPDYIPSEVYVFNYVRYYCFMLKLGVLTAILVPILVWELIIVAHLTEFAFAISIDFIIVGGAFLVKILKGR